MPDSQITYSRPGIAGSGAIACGLAAAISQTSEVILLARSESSAARASETVTVTCGKLEGAVRDRVKVTSDPADIADCDLVVESVIEDLDVKTELLAGLAQQAPQADLGTTTSSLSVTELGQRSGHADRVFGLHVFNPVIRMELIEVCVPDSCRPGLRERVSTWCSEIGKTAVEVPDQAGFVVNRLLFPYLFDAVRLLERTGMEPTKVDTCMTLGAGLPMGPLALLDFVGLDVAEAIGEALHDDTDDPAHRAPGLLVQMVGEGKLGRKSGEGFFNYS